MPDADRDDTSWYVPPARSGSALARPRSARANVLPRRRAPSAGPLAIVLGSDEVASAIAHDLRTMGCAVVLSDDIDPPGALRGMAFVNAWYLGSAELDGIAACFCSSVKSIPEVIDRQQLVAATSWSWQGVAALLHPDVLIDARFANGGVAEPLRGRVPGLFTIGCGPAYQAPAHADAVVNTSFGTGCGDMTIEGLLPETLGERPRLGGAGDERFVVAPRSGRFRTQLRIGDFVQARDPIGDVNGTALAAPISGALRGLSARGARVRNGTTVAEIDPRGEPSLCFGLDPRATKIAAGVVRALGALAILPGQSGLDMRVDS
ncbi:MAG TPA: hypothetical protein VMV45_05095 [Casimicrobiaceae bacterium]|nr:hypothetical protein [Casimicrobiaceae bacterium]